MEDIKVIHKLNENVNQRIAFIKDDEEHPLDIIISKDKNISYFHAVYIKKYLDFFYLEDKVLQEAKPKISPLDSIMVANIFFYLINQYQTIIFVETTEDNCNQKYGILYLPEEITKIQLVALQEFSKYLEKFTSILIQGGLGSEGFGFTSASLAKELRAEEIRALQEYIKPYIKNKEKP